MFDLIDPKPRGFSGRALIALLFAAGLDATAISTRLAVSPGRLHRIRVMLSTVTFVVGYALTSVILKVVVRESACSATRVPEPSRGNTRSYDLERSMAEDFSSLRGRTVPRERSGRTRLSIPKHSDRARSRSYPRSSRSRT